VENCIEKKNKNGRRVSKTNKEGQDMRISPTNRDPAATRCEPGFTLIEMIGVLAVIAILAAVVVPKVFESINNARINNATMTYNTVKTAIADHYAKFGSIPLDGTTTPATVLVLPAEQFDLILLKEAFLDRPFEIKIGDGNSDPTHARVRLFDISGLTTTSVVDGTANTGFALSGSAGATNEITGSVCAEAVITGVTALDAKDLNDRLDSPALGAPGVNAADTKGRVKYAAPAGGITTVYIYLTHH
jgi:prepilin-type N-terminal cleavage/methylation domain-containing protein